MYLSADSALVLRRCAHVTRLKVLSCLAVCSLSKYISVCMHTLCLVFNVSCKCIYALIVLINIIKAEVVEVPNFLNCLFREFVRLEEICKNSSVGRQFS